MRGYNTGTLLVSDNLTVSGNITAGGSNDCSSPFWCAGAVSNTGVKQTSKGIYAYTAIKTANGEWEIAFGTAHTDITSTVT